jgi:hypothetical protein
METKVEHVAKRVTKTPGAKSLVIKIADRLKYPRFQTETASPNFQKANFNRTNDLSTKRNLGLVLARLHGWSKIAFVDDDITISRRDYIARLAGQLDNHQVAGMRVPEFPDNSVVCHARRLAGLTQDVFVTGAVLGVQCNNLPLPFFPDIYNEDWFFFAEEAAARKLPRVGQARQLEYDPFASPNRARCEEFGDLLAEGLYAFIGEEDPSLPLEEQLRGATGPYWSRFIEARHGAIHETRDALRRYIDWDADNEKACAALNSLAAAESQLQTITADLCVDYLAAWRTDLAAWQGFTNGVSNIDGTRKAMEFLELGTWTWAEFGVGVVDSNIEAAKSEDLLETDSTSDIEADVVDSKTDLVEIGETLRSHETAFVGVESLAGV